jgi:zinc-binding in reverse transcriptase
VNTSQFQLVQREFDDLLGKLNGIRIRQDKDQLLWIRSATGKFTVKSAYEFITKTPHIDSRLQKIWEIKAPTRVQMFCWLQAQKKISTIDQVIRRGWIVINMCYLCRAHLETRDHIFRGCPYAKQLRQYAVAAILTTRQLCQSYLSDTTDMEILTEEQDMYWRQM